MKKKLIQNNTSPISQGLKKLFVDFLSYIGLDCKIHLDEDVYLIFINQDLLILWKINDTICSYKVKKSHFLSSCEDGVNYSHLKFIYWLLREFSSTTDEIQLIKDFIIEFDNIKLKKNHNLIIDNICENIVYYIKDEYKDETLVPRKCISTLNFIEYIVNKINIK